jgi:hypothetical protein
MRPPDVTASNMPTILNWGGSFIECADAVVVAEAVADWLIVVVVARVCAVQRLSISGTALRRRLIAGH